jgi:hypothetical protein
MFFPWYLTLVYKTFNVATEASTVNYVQAYMVKDAVDDLSTRPIFSQNSNEIYFYMDGDILSKDTDYRETLRKQRGKKFTVKSSAKFPFVIKIFGQDFKNELTISFSIPVTGIRYYKDLDAFNSDNSDGSNSGN